MSYYAIGLVAAAIVALIGLVVWLLYARRSRYDRRRATGNIVWLGHMLIYSVARLIFDPHIQNQAFQTWGAAATLHGVIQVVADGFFVLVRHVRLQRLVRRALNE